MKLGTRESCEMMENFEKNFNYMRLDKEPKENWSQGQIYQDGEVNKLFKAYSTGYALARLVYGPEGDEI